MSEFIYKLNLPPLDEILTQQAQTELFVGKNQQIYKQYHPKDLLKSEWLTWKDVEWDFVNFFYKNNYRGIIHVDGPSVWGINWVYNGSGSMEYWLPEDVTQLPAGLDEVGSKRSECFTNKDPVKIYKTPPGAYLTDASSPHRASGYNGRYAFSLRCYYTNPISWEEAKVKFGDLFI